MKAWNTDANTIQLNEIKSSEVMDYLVMTPDIKDFLGFETRKMFIVAPKGFGKTYLLKIKSQLFREGAKGYKFLPERPLCERFTDVRVTFSKKDIIRFNDQLTWEKTWELCLYSLILRIYKSDFIPPGIKEIIGTDATSLASILRMFLFNREKIDKLYEKEFTVLVKHVQELSNDSNVNQLAIFVDNIDEAFEKYVGINRENVSEKIWVNAQLALLLVSNDLCSRNNHIKFYLTIRSEAYNQFEGSLKMQLDDLCVFLRYTSIEIKEIFVKNIKLMNEKNLIYPKAINQIEAFLGMNTIPHKFVVDDKGRKIDEDVFEFIFRHTYKRPREIVEVGKGLERFIESNGNIQNLGSEVNKISYSLFDQLKREIVPFFREDVFEVFCLKVSSNIISHEVASRINTEIKAELNEEMRCTPMSGQIVR